VRSRSRTQKPFPSHQQLLLSATSAVEARNVYVAGLIASFARSGRVSVPAGSHCRAFGFALPGAGNTTACQEYNQCTLLAALHESVRGTDRPFAALPRFRPVTEALSVRR
jgi:hypothetical protein